jgi:rod shape determining protein RodA
MSPLITHLEKDNHSGLLKKLDWPFLYTLCAITIISLINLYSATHGVHDEELASLFVKQGIYFIIGWIIFLFFTFLNTSLILRLAWPFYIFNLLAIVYVSIFGKVALGAQRWIHLGFFNYQPSETMKLALIFVLSRVLADIPYDPKGLSLRAVLIPIGIIMLPFIFVIQQPDLGTSLLLLIISGSMFLFVGIRKWIISAVILLGIVTIPIAWQFVLHDYQKQRIYSFLSPGSDPKGSGYNSIQSRIAIGSGQLLGKGFQKGTQSKLEFLPERHTDFIFSVLSEEHGFFGSFGVLILFMVILILGLRISATATDKASSILAVGVLSYLFWHMFVNIGMVTGLLPIVGVPLPLFSYGGSSLFTTMSALGILSGIAYRRYIF